MDLIVSNITKNPTVADDCPVQTSIDARLDFSTADLGYMPNGVYRGEPRDTTVQHVLNQV